LRSSRSMKREYLSPSGHPRPPRPLPWRDARSRACLDHRGSRLITGLVSG
jgi:hypothetical protein